MKVNAKKSSWLEHGVRLSMGRTLWTHSCNPFRFISEILNYSYNQK